MFAVFGLNGFLHFLHQPPPPSPLAIQFMTAAFASHYMALVFFIQLLGGVLLLSGRFVPLALTLLAPVIVNILNFHLTMDPAGIGAGALAAILWLLLFFRFRSSFSGILQAREEADRQVTL
jgi:uncharacterized membrane protein YphA (DoxX/SURF4 family)